MTRPGPRSDGDPRVVVGINDGHNASAALLVDGRIVAAVQEERLTRVKNQGGLPARAIEEVLRIGGVAREDVGTFAVANVFQDRYTSWDRESIRARHARRTGRLRSWIRRRALVRAVRKTQLRRGRVALLARMGIPADRLVLVDHHASHAAAAYWSSGWADDDVLVITADAYGDYLAATVSIATTGTIRRIAEIPAEYSIGQLYSNVTHLVGLVPLEHEHKVMGLAPYAHREGARVERIASRLHDLFPIRDGAIVWRTRDDRSMLDGADVVAEFFRHERFDVISAAIQLFLEDFLVEWVRNAVRTTGVHRVALGGGVFMNVKANQRILALAEVEALFVMPSAGDETNSFGAAFSVAAERGRVEPFRDLYLGAPPTSNGDIADALKPFTSTLDWHESADPDAEVVELLARGEVVARCVGRMEFGARALGHRSILANPARPDVVRTINDMIKERDFWMPFAPAVLTDVRDAYVVVPKPVDARFMTMAFDTKAEARPLLRAAVHPSDATARIQDVDAATAPDLYRLLSLWRQRTGNGALLNTSFNLHGSPIVATARDAVDVLVRSGLRVMQLGPFIVTKR